MRRRRTKRFGRQIARKPLASSAAYMSSKLSLLLSCIPHRSKAKNAQEAHEAIRPTDAQRQPGALPVTDSRLRRLYDLIWRRTLACQMAAASIRQV